MRVHASAVPQSARPLLLWPVPVAGYLLGSVPVAVLVARRAGFDPRATGDRNAGFWNVKGQVGWRRALPVLAGDTVKGALAGAVGLVVGRSVDTAYVAVAAAMVGHAWPVFASFHGGKSVLTFVGGMAVITPAPMALALAVLAGVAVTTRSFDRGARAGIVALPVLQLIFVPAPQVVRTGGLMAFIGAKFLLDRALQRRPG